MIQKVLFQILMSPLALLYGTGVALRNFFYRIGFLKGVSFDVPTISVGNLTVGGAGKTPHVEYLARWLQEYVDVTILSRGYKRKTKGFLPVATHHSVEQVGDEPLQYKRKFPQVGVYVSESRVLGIPKILSLQPSAQTILMDDAFQHRAVNPGLNILLTEFEALFTDDFLLPVGRLREWRSGYKRADVVIITKCPTVLPVSERQRVIRRIKLQPHQRIFFTTYLYGQPYHLFYPSVTRALQRHVDAIVVSAIAKTNFLLAYLESQLGEIRTIEYEDHHQFSRYEVAQMKKQFDEMEAEHKIILTTEKDAVRLERHRDYIRSEQMPIFVLPIVVSFLSGESEFRGLVKDYLLNFKA